MIEIQVDMLLLSPPIYIGHEVGDRELLLHLCKQADFDYVGGYSKDEIDKMKYLAAAHDWRINTP